MNVNLHIVFFIAAAICFGIKGAGVHTGQIDLMNIGFCLLAVGMIV